MVRTASTMLELGTPALIDLQARRGQRDRLSVLIARLATERSRGLLSHALAQVVHGRATEAPARRVGARRRSPT